MHSQRNATWKVSNQGGLGKRNLISTGQARLGVFAGIRLDSSFSKVHKGPLSLMYKNSDFDLNFIFIYYFSPLKMITVYSIIPLRMLEIGLGFLLNYMSMKNPWLALASICDHQYQQISGTAYTLGLAQSHSYTDVSEIIY